MNPPGRGLTTPNPRGRGKRPSRYGRRIAGHFPPTRDARSRELRDERAQTAGAEPTVESPLADEVAGPVTPTPEPADDFDTSDLNKLPLILHGQKVLQNIAISRSEPAGPPVHIDPQSVGVTPHGMLPRLICRGALRNLLKYIDNVRHELYPDEPLAELHTSLPESEGSELSEFSSEDENAINDQAWIKQGPHEARVTLDPLDPAGLKVQTTTGQEVKIAKGFEHFPFGRTGYRQSTVGQCLLDALIEVRHSKLFKDSSLSKYVGPPLSRSQMQELKEEQLRRILTIFDDVLFSRLPYLVGTKGWAPTRRLKLRTRVRTYKVIDGNLLAYLEGARLCERGSARSPGISIVSPSLKLIGMAVGGFAQPVLIANPGKPTRVEISDNLRRLRRYRQKRPPLPPTEPWMKRRLTHTEFMRSLGGDQPS